MPDLFDCNRYCICTVLDYEFLSIYKVTIYSFVAAFGVPYRKSKTQFCY